MSSESIFKTIEMNWLRVDSRATVESTVWIAFELDLNINVILKEFSE